MYDLDVVIRHRPLHVTRIPAEERVREIIESALAAWGIPIPDRLTGTSEPTFARRLAKTGEYSHVGADYSIVVKRSP
jgi:hypothetical protein